MQLERFIKRIIKSTPFYAVWLWGRGYKDVFWWEMEGRTGLPPSRIKYSIIKSFGKRFGIPVFVETGTYLGDAVMSVKNTFKKIYSIELSHEFSENAKKRFSKFSHIYIKEGDSAIVIKDVVKEVTEPCLFWLDAHYSGGNTACAGIDTPISEEIVCIIKNWIPGSVILIDDARLFNGNNGYPLIGDFRREVVKMNPGFFCEVKNDVIRIHENSRKELAEKITL